MRRLVPALILALLLSGCAVQTAESLYALPGRPRGFARLEAAMDASMAGLTYAAPPIWTGTGRRNICFSPRATGRSLCGS